MVHPAQRLGWRQVRAGLTLGRSCSRQLHAAREGLDGPVGQAAATFINTLSATTSLIPSLIPGL